MAELCTPIATIKSWYDDVAKRRSTDSLIFKNVTFEVLGKTGPFVPKKKIISRVYLTSGEDVFRAIFWEDKLFDENGSFSKNFEKIKRGHVSFIFIYG